VFDGDPLSVAAGGYTQALSEGHIELHGSAGDYLGRGMRGGHIRVRGDAGRSHRGLGDVGDFAGGAAPGTTEGMNEGTILVSGNVGHRTGDRMRRGMLVVKGSAGDYLGSRMKGGTIVVLGPTGRSVGARDAARDDRARPAARGGPASPVPGYRGDEARRARKLTLRSDMEEETCALKTCHIL